MTQDQKKLVQSKRMYGRWFLPGNEKSVKKKEMDEIEEYIKVVGKDMAMKMLRLNTLRSEDAGEGTQVGGEFSDPLPLRNDPYRFQIKAMQDFMNPLVEDIKEKKE